MGKVTEIREVEISELKPYENNAKCHGEKQIELICKSIKEFGFISPCLIDRDLNIIAGHGRIAAAKKLKMKTVPCLFVEGLTEEQRKAYILADNKLTELGDWDEVIVENELSALIAAGFDVCLTGFDYGGDKKEIAAGIDESMAADTGIPESHMYIYAFSVFGKEAEKVLMGKIPQDVADALLNATETKPLSDIADKIMEAMRNV